MVRVLQIVRGLDRGGMETFLMNIYRSIDRNQVQFDFLINHNSGDYLEEIEQMGGKVYYIPPRKNGFIEYCKQLDTFFSQHVNEYIAVHQHVSNLSSIEPLYYAKKYGLCTRVIHSHSSSISGIKLHYLTHLCGKIVVSRWATHYLGCSDKALSWLFGYTSAMKNAEMINNGIDTAMFVYNECIRSEVRRELEIAQNTIMLGHVGRFIHVKNHTFLVEIFREYHKKNPDSKLILVGVGERKYAIEKQVHDYGLQEDVLFLGMRTDINHLLQAMDVFVMPSLFEGLPVTLVEAQTADLPILASGTISHDSKLTDRLHFYSLSATSTEWAVQLTSLLSEPKRRDVSSEIKMKGFDIKETAERLIRMYSL